LKNLSEIIRKTKAEHKLDEIYKKPSRNQKWNESEMTIWSTKKGTSFFLREVPLYKRVFEYEF
jgi:hypothetical protein